MHNFYIDENKCIKCMECISNCPFSGIEYSNGKIKINENCNLCSICSENCKSNAIELTGRKSKKKNDNWSGICIYAEHFNGKLSSVVPELIGCAKKLKSDLNVPINAILLGSNLGDLINELHSYGVDSVWIIDNQSLNYFQEDVLAKLCIEIIKLKKPEIFLGGATVFGRSIFPKIATNLSTGLTADCTDLQIDSKTGLLKQTRPTFGGNILATILCEVNRPQMATVRKKVFEKAIKDDTSTGITEDLSFIPIPESSLEVLDYKEVNTKTVKLTDAKVIVSGGRGLTDKEDYINLDKLAKKLGGTVGATRAVVDAGFIPYSNQIGQTGKTVNPSLYFAFGISGAIQHLVGMKSSKKIIAINNDPNAPIFNISNYCIKGDAKEILPELISQIED